MNLWAVNLWAVKHGEANFGEPEYLWGGGTLLGWATLAWFLPGFAWLDRIVHGDGFHRGFRAWATISSPTGSFYTALRMSSVAV